MRSRAEDLRAPAAAGRRRLTARLLGSKFAVYLPGPGGISGAGSRLLQSEPQSSPPPAARAGSSPLFVVRRRKTGPMSIGMVLIAPPFAAAAAAVYLTERLVRQVRGEEGGRKGKKSGKRPATDPPVAVAG
jgi:hypothetical protein